MTDMHREDFESWFKRQEYSHSKLARRIALEAWQAALRYRDEQEKQA